MRKQTIIFILFLLNYNNSLFNSNQIDYCGILEQEYIWNVECDKSAVQDYFDDLGFSESESDILAELFFDYYSLHEKDCQWKATIIHISSESKRDYSNDIKDVKYVKIQYKLERYHRQNDDSAKHTISKLNTIYLYERDSELYAQMYLFHEFGFYSFDIYQAEGFFVAKNIKWSSVLSEINQILDEQDPNDYYSVNSEIINFHNEVGLKSVYSNENNTDLKEFSALDKFDSNGVMYEKYLKYGNNYIYHFVRSEWYFNKFLYENWLITVIIIAVIIVILLLIYFKYIKKR